MMDMSHQSYSDTMDMPVKRFYDYIKWKNDLEEKKQKTIQELLLAKQGKTRVF
jgi:hypothetical protein